MSKDQGIGLYPGRVRPVPYSKPSSYLTQPQADQAEYRGSPSTTAFHQTEQAYEVIYRAVDGELLAEAGIRAGRRNAFFW